MARPRDAEDGPVRGLRCLAPLPVQFQRVGLVLLAAVALGVLVLVIVTGLLFEAPGGCSAHVYACGVTSGVTGIAVAALIGVVGFVLVRRHVLRRYWRVAKTQPRSLVAAAAYEPKLGTDASANAELIAETIVSSPTAGLRGRPSWARLRPWFEPLPSVPPQLVVGPAGEGKTTLLVELTRLLAGRGRVPVPVSLRGVESFEGFAALAQQAFYRSIDEALASSEEADRIWRWVCWTGSLVVLADDLQRLDVDRARLAGAFREAERERYALVATSRPDGVGPALEAWRVPLSPPDVDRAFEEAGGDPREPTPLDEALREVIEVGELNESRYYISVLACLREHEQLSADMARSQPTPLAVRRWLLERYCDAYARGALSPGDTVAPDGHVVALAAIAEQCFVALQGGEDASIEVSGPELQSAVAAGLLRRTEGEDACVEHALLQSYLASLHLEADQPEEWVALVEHGAGRPEVRDALLFYAGRPDRAQTARAVAAALLACEAEGSERVSIAVAAADLALAAGVDGLEPVLVGALQLASLGAGALESSGLVERLARLGGDDAIRCLWEICDAPTYRVSWEAGCALAGTPSPPGMGQRRRATQAARVLEPTIRTAIEQGEQLAGRLKSGAEPASERWPSTVDDWHPVVRPLKRLGWILPVLAVGADDRAVFAHLEHVLPLCGVGAAAPTQRLTEQRGPESSIAQGFKAAARLAAWDLHAEHGPPATTTIDELLQRMTALYEGAGFWYSKLVLLHGLTDLVLRATRAGSGEGTNVGEARRIIKDAERAAPCGAVPAEWRSDNPQPAGEHAFVVETATLCATAIKEIEGQLRNGADDATLRAVRDRYIWDDEGLAVGTPPTGLTPEALRLLGDVAVLLNLNEAGARHLTAEGVACDRALREQFGTNNHLPWCLSRGENRDVLLDAQDKCQCAFKRCPYPSNVQRAHRELSKHFCRQARAGALDFSPPPWQARLRGATSWHFWMEMERKAKYGA